ncbi:MAG: nitroreductase [Deltaproteobacteria bacterium RIFOXYD12_FULL_57_12]|nr:MAG: nitroreductase [Deltaproteobacteria bacterium RIFOXYD12_FULL_57_12]
MTSPVLTAIYQRRSIREFTDEEVSPELLREMIRAGSWAPSGLNNQPWRFVIVRTEAIREQLAEQTHYGHIVRAARALIAVYLDTTAMYDSLKDHQAAGACIQNMLLAAEALGLGAVWLGQILKNKKEVNRILMLEDHFDLMAVLAIGHPQHRNQQSKRRDLPELLLKEL